MLSVTGQVAAAVAVRYALDGLTVSFLVPAAVATAQLALSIPSPRAMIVAQLREMNVGHYCRG